MSLSNEEITKLAKLARLHVRDEDLEMYRDSVSSILEYVEKLQELDTTGVAELQHAADITNVFRDDEANLCDEDIRKRVVDNFTNKQGDLMEAQAVFGDSE